MYCNIRCVCVFKLMVNVDVCFCVFCGMIGRFVTISTQFRSNTFGCVCLLRWHSTVHLWNHFHVDFCSSTLVCLLLFFNYFFYIWWRLVFYLAFLLFLVIVVTRLIHIYVVDYAANRFRIFFGVFSSFKCLVVYRNALSSGSALTAGCACNNRTQPLTSICEPRTNAPTGCTWSYKMTKPTITRSTNKCVSSRSICDNNLLQEKRKNNNQYLNSLWKQRIKVNI